MSRTDGELADRIVAFLREGPAHFEDVLLRFRDVPYREILRAWGRLREDGLLGRELETGKYLPSGRDGPSGGDGGGRGGRGADA
ncbi:MAG: hypothetical protein ACE5IM_03840 [Nitrospinota bacterium]